MDTLNTALALTVHEIENEPRILDTDLAEALGMALPRAIRKDLIEAHRTALEALGSLWETATNPGPQGGRPGRCFHLNEEQATYVTMHAKTAKAQEVKLQIVRVFTAWRRGQLQPVATALPDFTDPAAAARAWAAEFEGRREAVALVEKLAPRAEVANRIVEKKRTLRDVAYKLPNINMNALPGRLVELGYLRKHGTAYVPRAAYRDRLFVNGYTTDGYSVLEVLPLGYDKLHELYRKGLLVMKKGKSVERVAA